MAIKVPSEIIPNATDQKVTDAKYVKHTHHEGESDEEIMTQSSINESVLDGDIFKTINGNSIVGEGNIYTSTDSYVVCNTAADVAVKEVVVNNYQLANGGNIRIKFTYANTATNVSLKIKASASDTSAVSKSLYYSGNPVSSTNTWSNNETVAVYYDGTNYMANNVAGAELKSTTNTTNPDNKKGVTESALVSVIGDVRREGGAYMSLQDQIYAITASSATVSLSLNNRSGYSVSTVRQVGEEGTTDIIPLYSESTTKAYSLTLQGRLNNTGDWAQVVVPEGKSNPVENTMNSGDNFYIPIDASTVQTHNFYVTGNIFNIPKNSSVINIYYVYGYFNYCLFERENSVSADPNLTSEEIATLSDAAHRYYSLTITPRGASINLNITNPTENYFNYLYFMIPTAPAGGNSTINYLILTSGSYTSTLAMDVVSEGSSTQWSQQGGDVPDNYTIYRTVAINTTGTVNLRTY